MEFGVRKEGAAFHMIGFSPSTYLIFNGPSGPECHFSVHILTLKPVSTSAEEW